LLLFDHEPGCIIAEVARPVANALCIGRTVAEPVIRLSGEELEVAELKSAWEGVLEHVFPTKPYEAECPASAFPALSASGVARHSTTPASGAGFAKPRALILAFPGANSDLDAARAVSRAGGIPKILVIRNLTAAMIEESIAETAKAIGESQILIIPGGSSLGDEPDGPAKYINLFFRKPRVADAVLEHLKSRDGLMLGICNGFQALVRLGLVPFGEIIPPDSDRPTLTLNLIGRHQAKYVYTRVASVDSPWMSQCKVGDVHAVAISHGEGRFAAPDEMLLQLCADGRVATQYTDAGGNPSMDTSINPNGSMLAVEGLFSPGGRVFGKMGHAERRGEFAAVNIHGEKHQPIFESGIGYFR
jgi:phosphoribosylformylglycinamidine synthase